MGRFRAQSGATLVEVLVAILILSLGMLALSGMMAFTVQLPKLSGYRATAATLASSHIERIRANRTGFLGGEYITASSYNGTFDPLTASSCDYPNCTPATLAAMDDEATKAAARATLPAGGVMTTCDPHPCSANSMGNIWVIWQEPDARAILDVFVSDNCPLAVTSSYTNPRPRCLYARFKP
jgi:type IV pilus assembly protein PilV